MATLTAQFSDVNKLVANFEELGYSYFVITDANGNTLRRNDSEEDISAAGEIIKSYFDNIDQSNRSVFTIRHYEKPTFKTGSKSPSEPDAVSTFKIKAAVGDIDNYQPRQYNNNYQQNQYIIDELREMKAELAALKLANEIEDEIEEDEPQSELSGLGAILNHPLVSQLLTGLAANLMTPKQQAPQLNNRGMFNQPQAMAGINDYQEDTLDLLFSKGVTNGDLHLLSLKPIEQINLLLSMLRNAH